MSNNPSGSYRPRWSPTGSHIAYDVGFEDSDGSHEDVYIVPASGGDAVNVTDDPASSTGGAWSPDGSRFVFVTDRDGNDEIYVADGDGRNPVRLTNNRANDRDPAWSPDGSQIAFSSGLDVWSETRARMADRGSLADLCDGCRRRQSTCRHRRIHRSGFRHPRSTDRARGRRRGRPTAPGCPSPPPFRPADHTAIRSRSTW